MTDSKCVYCEQPIKLRVAIIELCGGMFEAEPGEPLIFVPVAETAHAHVGCQERAFHLFNKHKEH